MTITEAEGGYDATGDTCNSPLQTEQSELGIDWSTLTIVAEPELDGEAIALLDDNKLFEAMGFKETEEKAAEQANEEAAIPVEPMNI